MGPRRPAPGLPTRLAYNLRLPLRLDARRFDLVVGFDFDGCFLPRPGDPPFVVSLKGIAADEQRFETGVPKARLRAQAALEAWNVHRADGVVVTSRYSRGWARRAYGAPRGRTAVVPEGLDLDRWGLDGDDAPGAGKPTSGDGGPLTILSVARQYRRKNTAALIEATARLARRGLPVRLRVVGGGPELERLRALAARSGLGDRVRLPGEIPSDAVSREYRNADVFCLPSLQEGFGIVYLEAMASGLPVVACRAGAAPEVVPHGETGLLCEPGATADLVRSLRRLLTDPVLRREMGERGRRRAARYGWPRVAGRFLSACREILRPGGPGCSAADERKMLGSFSDGPTTADTGDRGRRPHGTRPVPSS